jgi:hypothetical protein
MEGLAMTSRKEIVELLRDLPIDDAWLPTFMERLKEKYPGVYDQVIEQAQTRIKELEHDKK